MKMFNKTMINEDQIKQSFIRAKQDIQDLQSQLDSIKQDLNEIKQTLDSFASYILKSNISTNTPTHNPTDAAENQTIQQISPTHLNTPTHNLTDNLPLYSLKNPNTDISTGNQGVPTDRQTDRQTDQHIHLSEQKPQKSDPLNHLEKVSEILDSLDDIKKDLRSKFKKLTSQEILVFSAIYQLQEQSLIVDYPSIASKLNLSESSIRDYTQKIIKKGIPIEKTKENNKKITLSIPEDLRKIASLQTILALREL